MLIHWNISLPSGVTDSSTVQLQGKECRNPNGEATETSVFPGRADLHSPGVSPKLSWKPAHPHTGYRSAPYSSAPQDSGRKSERTWEKIKTVYLRGFWIHLTSSAISLCRHGTGLVTMSGNRAVSYRTQEFDGVGGLVWMAIADIRLCCARLLSHIRLFVTPWTVPRQAPLSMGFSRKECWSGLPFPPPRDLPNPGIEPRPSALQDDSLLFEPPGKPTLRLARLNSFVAN